MRLSSQRSNPRCQLISIIRGLQTSVHQLISKSQKKDGFRVYLNSKRPVFVRFHPACPAGQLSLKNTQDLTDFGEKKGRNQNRTQTKKSADELICNPLSTVRHPSNCLLVVQRCHALRREAGQK